MRFVRILVHRIQSLLGRSSLEAELQREIDLHIEQLTKEYVRSGMNDSDARLAARREFGAIAHTKEECRDMRRVNFFEDLMKDLVYALRLLRKSPGFTLTAVLSLALGIGANTVVFSVINALVLKPLPVLDADRIFFVNNSGHPSNSFPNYRAIRDRNSVFQSLFSYRIIQIALDDNAGAQSAGGHFATGNYFETLGLKPALGGFFTPAKHRHANASPYPWGSFPGCQNGLGGRAVFRG